ncbi:MAG: tRNA dihydrouridine synthase DusB [Oscillospiraceae bacterium]|nr:tRNA dihydrouridine synthase DusB [Oscillospiraceae bacterium]
MRSFSELTAGRRLALAPMAGVTDLAFRAVCRAFAPLITVTEMVSSRGLVYRDAKTVRLTALGEGEHPAGVQIFGSDPSCMAEAAVIALDMSGADFVDINMGCPTPKIVKNGDGCALMRDPPLAGRIVEAVCAAVDVPVTVKFRRGWDKGSLNAVEFARICEQAGASAVCVHGRTKAQMYAGAADWDDIAAVRAAVGIPVIVNGDIHSAETALRAKRHTGADFVMAGRAALGNPFVFAELDAALNGRPIPGPPTPEARAEWAGKQFALALEHKGERAAVLEARRHFCWYLHGLPRAGRLKAEIVAMRTRGDACDILKKMAVIA